jgi:hypothetical protein
MPLVLADVWCSARYLHIRQRHGFEQNVFSLGLCTFASNYSQSVVRIRLEIEFILNFVLALYLNLELTYTYHLLRRCDGSMVWNQ